MPGCPVTTNTYMPSSLADRATRSDCTNICRPYTFQSLAGVLGGIKMEWVRGSESRRMCVSSIGSSSLSTSFSSCKDRRLLPQTDSLNLFQVGSDWWSWRRLRGFSKSMLTASLWAGMCSVRSSRDMMCDVDEPSGHPRKSLAGLVSAIQSHL